MGRMNVVDALMIFGGLALVAICGLLFAFFPMYQLLDTSSVRRPIWDPPRITIREAGQGLTPEDLARLEQIPGQRELLEGLKKPIIFQPSPSWFGHHKIDMNKPTRGRRLPTNGLLYLFALSAVGYFYALKHRGIL